MDLEETEAGMTVLAKASSNLTYRPISRERERESADRQSVEGCGSWGRRQFVNPEKGEHPPLEAVTKQRSEDRDWEHKSVCDSDL
jgi:hypothetical protein